MPPLYQPQRGRLTRALGFPSLDFSFTFADGSGDAVSGEVDGLLVGQTTPATAVQIDRRYIQDFIRLKDETATAQELYDRMLALYPDRINPGSLWGSANAAKASRRAEA